MKKLFSLLLILSLPFICFGSPTNNISIPNSFTPNTTISSSSMNSNFNEIQTKFNTHSHNDIINVGSIVSGVWAASIIDKTYGGTGNAYGIGLPSGAVFFMLTGSCPAGTTDITATYTGKFLMVNAAQGSTGGATTTSGTTDSHILSTTEMPSHTHGFSSRLQNANSGGGGMTMDTGGAGTATSDATGGGGGHTHTITNLSVQNPYVTAKLCQCN